MRRTSIDLGFWARIVGSSIVVNVPLAVSMVVYGMHPGLAFGLSGIAGVATLLIWDGRREQPAEEAMLFTEDLERKLDAQLTKPVASPRTFRLPSPSDTVSSRSTSEPAVPAAS